MNSFDGLEMNLGSLPRLSHAQTRSISAENPTEAQGRGAMSDPDPNGPARELGRGWKCSPCQRDICSVAYWYQTLPAAPFPELPDRNGLEVV